MKLIYSLKNREEQEVSKKIGELVSNVHEVLLEETLGEQETHYVAEEFFEPITKTVIVTNEELLEQFKTTTEAIEGFFKNLSGKTKF